MCEALLQTDEPSSEDYPIQQNVITLPPPFPTEAEREKLLQGRFSEFRFLILIFVLEQKFCRQRKISKKAQRGRSLAIELFG